MRFRFLIVVGICTFLASLAPAQDNTVDERFRGLDEIIEKYLEEWDIPGLAIAIFTDDEIVYMKGFGYKDLESKAPVTETTLFGVGSVTKNFTSFAAAILVDQGKLDFDIPINDYMPSFRLYTDYLTHNVTVRDVLSHRTGIPECSTALYYTGATRYEFLGKMRYYEPSYPLRYKFQYNGGFYIALSAFLEHVGGQTWEDLLTENVLKPLKMDSTFFVVDDAIRAGDLATPYQVSGGEYAKQSLEWIDITGAAGAIISNVVDLSKWVQMHIKRGEYGGRTIISEDTFKQLVAPTMARERSLSQSQVYGLGWHVMNHRGHDLVEHMGNITGYTGYVGFLPNEKIGFAFVMNRNYSSIPFALVREALDRMLGYENYDWVGYFEEIKKNYYASSEHTEPVRVENTSPTLPLSQYAGAYENGAYGKITITVKDNKLAGSYFGKEFVMEHYHYNVFVPDNSMLKNDKLNFIIDRNGHVEAIAIDLEPEAPSEVIFKKLYREK